MIALVAKDVYTAREAAQALGISLDTCAAGTATAGSARAATARNRRVVSAKEIARLRGDDGDAARERAQPASAARCARSKVDGLLAQVEILVTEPARVVAIVTRDAVEELGLEPGSPATAIVKATSVMVER